MVKPSRDSVARAYIAVVLISGPRLVGVDQPSVVVPPLAVQMSGKTGDPDVQVASHTREALPI